MHSEFQGLEKSFFPYTNIKGFLAILEKISDNN